MVSFAGRCVWHRCKDGVWQFSSPDEIQKIIYRRELLKKDSLSPERREKLGKEIQELSNSFVSKAASIGGFNGVNFADAFNGGQDPTAVIAGMSRGVNLAGRFKMMGLSKLVPSITLQDEKAFQKFMQDWLQRSTKLNIQAQQELEEFLNNFADMVSQRAQKIYR